MMSYLQLQFRPATESEQERLIAVLSSIQFDSFHQNENELLAYIEETIFDKYKLQQTLDQFQLSAFSDRYEISRVANKNWNTLWESNYPPVIIADQILIKAPFHTIEKSYPYIIELEPKMAFGTGHHETTSMVLEAMLAVDFTGKRVLDFGCGTGILAIFASIKKALYIDAIDNDNWAFDNAKQNIQQAGIDNIVLSKGTLQSVCQNQYDVILANINKNVITEAMSQLYNMILPKGTLIISGILREDVPEIEQLGLSLFRADPIIQFKGNWSMLRFVKEQRMLYNFR